MKRPLRVRFFAHGSLSSIHRLHVSWDWYDEDRYALSVWWGERYGDPVWCVGVEVRPPRWYLRRSAPDVTPADVMPDGHSAFFIQNPVTIVAEYESPGWPG